MIKVLEEKCTMCKRCTTVCSSNSISIKNNKINILETCINFKGCISYCKFNAIQEIKTKKNIFYSIGDYRGIFILGECRSDKPLSVVYELIGEGKKLAQKLDEELAVVLVGNHVKEAAKEVIAYGADRVYLVELEDVEGINESTYVNIFHKIIDKYKPEIVLIGATLQGRSIAPRLATRLGTGLTADCTRLDIDMERRLLLQTRPAMGESLMATIICENNRPQMASVRPSIFKVPTPCDTNVGNIIEISANEEIDRQTEIIKIVENIMRKEDKEIIVAGGRGMQTPENFGYLKKLAEILNAGIGATRPIVDEGWIGYEHQIGQTGKIVSPKIYFAFGISGATQHLIGITSADIIVAINKDQNAPIFNIATFGILGDAVDVARKLISELNKKI